MCTLMHSRGLMVMVMVLLLGALVIGVGRGQSVPACSPSEDFSIDLLASETPQLYAELGSWAGNITCFESAADGTLTRTIDNGRMTLNTTVDAARSRLLSCSQVEDQGIECRALYPLFDGTGTFCIAEVADLIDRGYPLYRRSKILNRRLVVDSAWSQGDELISGNYNYHEPGNMAISGFFGVWGEATSTGRPPAVQCLFRILRTCQGPACFTAPPELDDLQ